MFNVALRHVGGAQQIVCQRIVFALRLQLGCLGNGVVEFLLLDHRQHDRRVSLDQLGVDANRSFQIINTLIHFPGCDPPKTQFGPNRCHIRGNLGGTAQIRHTLVVLFVFQIGTAKNSK